MHLHQQRLNLSRPGRQSTIDHVRRQLRNPLRPEITNGDTTDLLIDQPELLRARGDGRRSHPVPSDVCQPPCGDFTEGRVSTETLADRPQPGVLVRTFEVPVSGSDRECFRLAGRTTNPTVDFAPWLHPDARARSK